jgi:hypothetical protein
VQASILEHKDKLFFSVKIIVVFYRRKHLNPQKLKNEKDFARQKRQGRK